MAKIRLFRTFSYDCDYDSTVITSAMGDDWEDVSDDDLKVLRTHLNTLFPGGDVVIVEKIDTPITTLMGTIVELIAKAKQQQEAARIKKEQQRTERQLKKLAQTKADEIALLQQLQQKYGDGNVQ